VHEEKLDYFCNTQLSYAVRGVHVKLNVLWNYESTPGADTHFAYYRGSRAKIEIRQAKAETSRPELYVIPNSPTEKEAVGAALTKKIGVLLSAYPGLSIQDQGKEFHIEIPGKYRVGHEAHFAQVTNKLLNFLKDPKSLPTWEKPNMLAKYYLTTQGIQLAR